MKKYILLFICILCFVYTGKASECYHYHTPHYYKLFVENNQIVFQHTVKDPNKVSYVSQENIVLKNINSQSFKILAENQGDMLFSTIDGYFVLHKNVIQVKDYGVRKIGSHKEVNESIGVNFFCINNQWKYIKVGHYTHRNSENNIAKMPLDLEVITDFPSQKILLKNSENVFYFHKEKFTFHKIERLIGKHTRFFRLKNRHTTADAFLYDENTFYRISVHNIDNLTSDFTSQQENSSFKNLKIYQIEDNVSLDTGDGFLWLYKENGLIHKQKEYSSIPIHFVRKKASYLNSHTEFITYNDKIYDNFYDLVKGNKSIDFSSVKNKEQFHKETGDVYSDGLHKYYYDYNSKKMILINWLSGNDLFHPRIYTYNGHGNSELWIGKSTINKFSADPKEKGITISYTSSVKSFTIAHAYNDKLLIENKSITNIAHKESMSFLGSIVDIISPCDGGRGQYPVEIDVYYFFKDKDKVYVCNTTNLKMKVIKNLNPLNYEEDTYEQLAQLMQQVKNLKK
ncbi:hypothetical protein [Aquimarina sp. I32.4]|uniref:hypothetical protein n=1 Tax=Aquimarina sp. I32.4 TaxID=2053903 RepID=UPI000CDF264B|nr:hypothetical protein [Aquimarina sp. I32.4]